MVNLFELAAEIQAHLEEIKKPFCFIGGLALQHWGEPRVTRDIDLQVFTGLEDDDNFIKQLLNRYETRIDDPTNFALTNRVMLLRSQSGIGIDLSLAFTPYEQEVIDRSVLIEYLPKVFLRICSAEDLIVLKSFAARDKDWIDVQGVLIRQNDKSLNFDLIIDRLKILAELKDEPEIVDRLCKLRIKTQKNYINSNQN